MDEEDFHGRMVPEQKFIKEQNCNEKMSNRYNYLMEKSKNAIDKLLKVGIQKHKLGHLEDARTIYLRVLDQEQTNFDATHLLGVIYLQLNNAFEAERIIKRATELNPKYAPAFYNHALALQRLRRLDEAISSYDNAIALNPNYAQAYCNRGSALKDKNLLAQALKNYDQAIAIDSKYLDAYFNRGVALQALGRLREAVVNYDKVVALDPNYHSAYINRGNAFRTLGETAAAIGNYDQAIKMRPLEAETHYSLGIALSEVGRFTEASASFELAVSLFPEYADAHYALGYALQSLDRLDEAIASYQNAIAFNANNAEAYSNLGVAFHKLQKFETASKNFEKAIACRPNYADAYNNFGVLLQDMNRLDDALRMHETTISINPHHSPAHMNLGLTLQKMNRLTEAISSYSRALSLTPSFAEAYFNRGNAYDELGATSSALSDYDRAIALKVEYTQAYWNKSLALLKSGELLKGWELYEWGWKVQQRGTQRVFNSPLWLGAQSLAGKTVLLHSEQGLGDCIQFSRYANLCKAQGARVILAVPATLVSLFRNLPGADLVLELDAQPPSVDFHCPMLSLPLAFKTEINSIPGATPYLYSSEEKRRKWVQRLGLKSKPRIGVAWSSNSKFLHDTFRSMNLEEFFKGIAGSNIEIICLQKEIKSEDQKYFHSVENDITFFGPELHDFSDTAALASCMDLVVSTCTSVPHLTGALGIPTWILLSKKSDWRWMRDREDSPWYPSVKLFRQQTLGDWGTVLSQVKAELEKLGSRQ